MQTPLVAVAGEHVPESQGLVACAGDDRAAVWAHRQVQHTHRVPHQRADLLHLGVFPNVDLVKRVAVRTDNFVYRLRKGQIADLGSSIDGFDRLARQGVSETNMPVCCAAS